MVTRQQIVDEAFSWLGTPYHHQACVKGVGVDCAHLLVGVAKSLALIPADWVTPHYAPGWHNHVKIELFDTILIGMGCEPYMLADGLGHGDILTFRMAREQSPSHAGIAVKTTTGTYLIHALFERKVLYHRLAGRWSQSLAHAYRFPGVTP